MFQCYVCATSDKEAGCFKEAAAFHSDHLKQVPSYTGTVLWETFGGQKYLQIVLKTDNLSK